ncbi:MAG: AMP-binding protein [Cryobacterium sp.]|nr:AMP-binding protein [Cryobacterium sp.]
MRELIQVSDEPLALLGALRNALGGGPAIAPVRNLQERLYPNTVDSNVSIVIQTSGSTAEPKQVALGAAAATASARASAERLGGTGQWLLAVPTSYVAGINVLVRSICANTEPVVIRDGFSEGAFFEAAKQMNGDAKFTSLVPNQLSRLLEKATKDELHLLSRFDRILIGGQRLQTQVLDKALEAGLKISRTYGSTETFGGCVYDGEPLPGVQVRTRLGAVEISGPTLAEGYLENPALTNEKFVLDDGTRWYRTDDLGEIVDGKLRISGRSDDVIISGGIKVSAAAIEQVVRSIPGVTGAVVFGVEDEHWGQVPIAFIEGVNIELGELRELVGAQLGPAARPARLTRLETIPRLSNGKPNLIALRNR